MGNLCGGDIFEMLMAKYGEDFAKFIAGEKGKELVGTKTEEGKQTVSKQIQDYKQQVLGEITKQEGELNSKIDHYKGQLPSSIPSALGSPDELLGANAFKEKFEDMKKEVDSKFGDVEQ